MKQKLSCIVFLALVMLVISISPIYAGNWKKDNKGWWYQENDGTYPKDDYKYVNEQWYYFDQEGYMVGIKLMDIGIISKLMVVSLEKAGIG